MSLQAIQRCCKSKDVRSIAKDAGDFAYSLGMVMKSAIDASLVQHLPFTLTPSPVPKILFNQALNVQEDFNLLMHNVSSDLEFLESSLSSVMEVDDFTRRLFEIHKTVLTEAKQPKLKMALIRSDYMFDTVSSDIKLKQIEINMIASSFGGCTDKVLSIHKKMLHQNNIVPKVALPENNSLHGLAESLISAWEAYGVVSSAIVMIIDDNERNVFDQRNIENEIYNINPEIKFRRLTFLDIYENGKLSRDGKLLVCNEEVAVVYYRHGYIPQNYPTEKEWKARTTMEKSCAISCPNVGYQLVGAKKIQEVLSQESVVEKFIKDPKAVKRIRDTFAGLYTLDLNEAGNKACKMAIENPGKYVLKPQREGGGNNLYDEDIVTTLNEVGSDERRCSYILMDKIKPMPVQNVIVANLKHELVEAVSELGVFGYILSNGDELLVNNTLGHLLRSKASHHKDGGVAAGVAVLDSPLLY